MNSEQTKSNNSALYTLLPYFFLLGFIIKRNFIPFCKAKFGLDQFQSQLLILLLWAYYVELYCFSYLVVLPKKKTF
jgi:FHS family L-fucose permease-like MFS transporter